MARRSSNTLISARDRELQRLQEKLSKTRETVIDLLPPDIRQRVSTYWDCKTHEAARVWEHDFVDWVIDRAEPIPDLQWWEGTRAYCPLCGGSNRSAVYNEQGYALPRGLERHLQGLGNAYRCEVVEVILDHAHDYWRTRLGEPRFATEHTRDEHKWSNKTYRTSPFGQPKRLEDVKPPATPREEFGFRSIDLRLERLGPKRIEDGDIISWVDDRKDSIVYADPLEDGHIIFEVWRKPLPTKRETTRPEPDGRFNLSDRHYFEPEKKYARCIAKALGRQVVV